MVNEYSTICIDEDEEENQIENGDTQSSVAQQQIGTHNIV
jgi:hypothetical protein